MTSLLTPKIRYLIHEEDLRLKVMFPSDYLNVEKAILLGWKEVTMEEYLTFERWYLAGTRDTINKIKEVLK